MRPQPRQPPTPPGYTRIYRPLTAGRGTTSEQPDHGSHWQGSMYTSSARELEHSQLRPPQGSDYGPRPEAQGWGHRIPASMLTEQLPPPPAQRQFFEMEMLPAYIHGDEAMQRAHAFRNRERARECRSTASTAYDQPQGYAPVPELQGRTVLTYLTAEQQQPVSSQIFHGSHDETLHPTIHGRETRPDAQGRGRRTDAIHRDEQPVQPTRDCYELEGGAPPPPPPTDYRAGPWEDRW